MTREEIIAAARAPELVANPAVARLCDLTLDLTRDVERLRTGLRRIVSLGEKNVPKYAQQIARETLREDR